MLLLLPIPAQADGWVSFQETWRLARHGPTTLLVPKAQLKPDYVRSDDDLVRLVVGGDTSVRPVEGQELAVLQAERGWKEGPHWIVLDRDGTVLDEGTNLPTGEQLRSLLLARGFQPTWEALEQFIRLHPDNGAALQRKLSMAYGLTRNRFRRLVDQGKAQNLRFTTESRWPFMIPARVLVRGQSDVLVPELVDTLDQLSRLPDPWRLGNSPLITVWINAYGNLGSTNLKESLARFGDTILEAWRKNPHSGRIGESLFAEDGEMMAGLGPLWLSCEMAAHDDIGLPDLPQLAPSPGRHWPPWSVLTVTHSFRSGRDSWKDTLTFLDRLPPDPPDHLLWEDSWSESMRFRAEVFFWRAIANAEFERWPEAISALLEYRRHIGKYWVEAGRYLKELYSKPSKVAENTRAQGSVDPVPPESFFQVLRLPPFEDPPRPVRNHLRFLTWGHPEWVSLWPSTRATAPLAPWGPGELKEESPTQADLVKLRLAGLPEQGWAVFLGDSELVARGEAAPDPKRLASLLQGVASSRIHILDGFLATHPDHLDARRDRYTLVRARMPQPALEARLLEDATQATLPLDFGPEAPWLSDREGWQLAAVKVVPELAQALHRWPNNGLLWRSWIAWSAFLPTPSSVRNFAASLPLFGSRQSWLADLPAQVHRAVSKECRMKHRFDQALEWFEEAWADLESRHLAAEEKPNLKGEREKAIYEGYREALIGLGRNPERVELDRKWSIYRKQASEAPKS